MEQEKSNEELLVENKRLTEELEKTRDQLGNARILGQEYKKRYEELIPINKWLEQAEERIKKLVQIGINVRDKEIENYYKEMEPVRRESQKLGKENEDLKNQIQKLEEKLKERNGKLFALGGENKVLRKEIAILRIELGKLLPEDKNEQN
jgi:predicted  nucleic acid-binding Zn-ribbon protein